MKEALVLALLAAGCGAAPGAVRAGAVEIRDAYVFETVLGDVASAYMSIRNTGIESDRLSGAGAAGAGLVMIHQQVEAGGQMVMRHLEAVEIPPGAAVVFAPGGLHLMLDQLEGPLAAGDTIDLVLHFERAGDVLVRAPVRRYGERE
ncbi:MAG TPA: copper chaperone PCu(A)C [Gemmatimonadales bacterium]|nr:copper chaperone PCu(A)C [Gemmatimonadales bacterium]